MKNFSLLQNNRLDTLPESASRLSSSLIALVAHQNNIAYVPRSFSAFWSSVSADNFLLSMSDNPSQCFYAYNIRFSGKAQVVCDCAAGFFGFDFCDTPNNYLRLPSVVSELGGLHLTSPVLASGSFNASVTVTPTLLKSVQDPSQNRNTFLLPINASTSSSSSSNNNNIVPAVQFLNVSLPAVHTVWGYDELGNAFTFSPTRSAISAFLYDILNIPVSLPATLFNTNVPASLRYSVSPELPGQLAVDSVTGSVTGAANVSASQAAYNITATDVFSGEQRVVSVVQLQVSDCGENTCLNGGVCDAGKNTLDGAFTCTCPTIFNQDKRCAARNPPDCTNSTCSGHGDCRDTGVPYDGDFECTCSGQFTGKTCADVAQASDSGISRSVAIIIGVLVGVGVLLLLGIIACLVRQRRKREEEAPDFDACMREMISQGLIAERSDSTVSLISIPRKRVTLSEKLGQGEYGTVHKVSRVC